MSSPSPGITVPGRQQDAVLAPQGDVLTSIGLSGVAAGFALIPILFTLVFHAGAAYLSYQRNQSMGWAFLHFFLAVFYYPYFAFTQPSSPAPASIGLLPTVQTAGRKLRKIVHARK
jgi:hypothetical protein